MARILTFLLILAFYSCNTKTAEQKEIIGKWATRLKSPKDGNDMGRMWLEFKENGDFLQTTGEGAEQVTAKLTYRITKDQIFYKGTSTGNEEFNANYHFKNGNTLIMVSGNEPLEYIRVKASVY